MKITDNSKETAPCKKHQHRDRQARTDVKEQYTIIRQIGNEIRKRAEEFGIQMPKEHTQQESFSVGPCDSEKARSMAANRHDKELQAVYTLLEANIEPVILAGLLIALTDRGSVGASMIRYFSDRYLPSSEIISWEKKDRGAITLIQQAFQVKLLADAKGVSIEDIQGLLSSSGRN